MKQFRSPKRSLGDLDAEVASKLIATSADLALVVDAKGIIRDVACTGDNLSEEGCSSWIGQSWIETVTVESRPKIEELLRDAGQTGRSRWRQVNHPTGNGDGDLPVNYATIQLGQPGKILAVGRDLRSLASLQQKLVETQQSLEREYARLRHTEARYRALFQMTLEPIVIVDAQSLQVIEANPAASQILTHGAKKLIGQGLMDLFKADSRAAVKKLVAAAKTTTRAEDVTVRLTHAGKHEYLLSASYFRQQTNTYFLLRLAPIKSESASTAIHTRSSVAKIVEALPDGLVVTDQDRRVLSANQAFLEMCQLSDEGQIKGEPLQRWLGRVKVDTDVLVANLREHGSVKRFATVVHGEFGTTDEVEVSAVVVPDGANTLYGLSVRRLERAPSSPARARQVLPRSVEQMTELVGRVPLKKLVRETTDIIEKLCIEAALELTDDNRASAAEMLGLSRQSFYAKLRRFGIQSPGAATDDDEAG